MDSQTSRKIIVASGMAVVLVIGAVTFALLPHHPSSAAQISEAPPPPVAPTPDVPAAVASTPEAAAAIAPIPDAPAVVAREDSVDSKVAHAAKVAGNRHLARASTSPGSTDRVVTPAEPTVDSSGTSAGETPATSVQGVKSVDEVTMPSSAGGTTPIAPTTTEPAASDTGSSPK